MGNSFVFFEPVISTIGEQASTLMGFSMATLPPPPPSFFVETGLVIVVQVACKADLELSCPSTSAPQILSGMTGVPHHTGLYGTFWILMSSSPLNLCVAWVLAQLVECLCIAQDLVSVL